MASKPPKKPPSRRRPPTIDLSATEISVQPLGTPAMEAEPAPAARDVDSAKPAGAPSVAVGGAGMVAASFDDGSSPVAAPDPAPPTHEPSSAPAAAAVFDEPPRGAHDHAESESPRAPPSPSSPPPPRTPWAQVGAAAAAVLVVIALVLSVISFMAPRDNSAAQLSTRIAALEAQLAHRTDQSAIDGRVVDALTARVAKFETVAATPPSPVTDPALASRLNSIEIAVKSLSESVNSLSSRTQEWSDALRDARERSEAASKALAELQAAFEHERAANAGKADKSEAERLAGRLNALESSTRNVEQKIDTPGSTAADRDVRKAMLAAALKDAVERGVPYEAQLAAIKPLIGDPVTLAALDRFASSGTPTEPALAHELVQLVPTLTRSATPPNDGSFLARLQANAGRLVRIRPVDDPAGDDPLTIVDRIDGKAQRGDVSGALSELAQLPAAARAPAEGWIAKAQARAAAVGAAQGIATDAVGALARAAR